MARNGGRLTITATHDPESDLSADVTDLHGQPVVGGVDGPPFGTAGSTDGSDRLDLTVDVPPWPVAVRLQHVGGTFLSITEAVVDPPGFPASCGSTPPVEIEVGGRDRGPRHVIDRPGPDRPEPDLDGGEFRRPGPGVMPHLLIGDVGAEVWAVEIDPEWVERLRNRFRASDPTHNVRVIGTDLRDLRLPRGPYRVVANPPFGLTTEILNKLLDRPDDPPVLPMWLGPQLRELLRPAWSN